MANYTDPARQLVVEIFVRDMDRSRGFYEALGFDLVEDKGDFVSLVWDGCQLFLAARPDLPPPPPEPVANVRVMAPDVDDAWAKAQPLGARIVTPIADRDYGLRDFTIADPDGFGVRFGSWLK